MASDADKLKISIIIPSFNEGELIFETYRRIRLVMVNNNFDNFEILFIDDGSRDNTLDILKNIASKDFKVKIISFSRNFGHQAAISAGINKCDGDIAIIADADLQDPPELFPEMIKIFTSHKCNVIYGARKERLGESHFKIITARVFYRILNYLSEVPLPIDTGDFRLIDRKVIEHFRNLKEKNKYIRGLISWIGFTQIPFYYSRVPRQVGNTKYSLSKMLTLASIGIQYFTKKPLKLAVNLGFLNILFGITLTIVLIGSKLFGLAKTVPGWTSLLVVIIFFGGIQLLTIGVLGEYIGSIFDEIKSRPEYIIAEEYNFADIGK